MRKLYPSRAFKFHLLLLGLFFCSTSRAQTVQYTSLYTSSSFNSKGVEQSLPVGALPGNASVTGNGGAAYSISIAVPPGTNGIVPTISLDYNSMGGNGVMGMGWSISGLSVITRVPKNVYYDGETEPVKISNGADNRYALDGQRLILKTGTYGASGATYGTESESFATITSYDGVTAGISRFEVITKEGVKMDYGNTVDSRLMLETNDFVLFWRLNRVTYPDGNYIEFVYAKDGRASRITEVRYTGNEGAGILPYNKIKFDYVTGREDGSVQYEAGSAVINSHLLSKITITTDEVTSGSYEFRYGNDNINTYLVEVTPKGSDGTALNSTIFKYGDNSQLLTTGSSDGIENPDVDTFTGDFNGDGKVDFLSANAEEVNGVRVNTSFTIFSQKDGLSGQPEYFFVDNVTSLPTNYTVVKKKDVPNAYQFLSYDFDGDGADDVLTVNRSSSTLSNIRLYKSVQNPNWSTNGNLPIQFTEENISPYSGYNKIHSSGHFIFPGDFNGDGVQDILTMLGNSGNNYYSHLYFGNVAPTFLTAGTTGTVYFAMSQWATVDYVKVLDFNGDGKSDLMLIKDNHCEIFTFSGYSASRIFYSSNSVLKKNSLFFFGDFNGDRKTDILLRSSESNNSANWYRVLSTGTDILALPFVFQNTPSLFANLYYGDDLCVADFNGDGKSDIFHARDPNGSSTTYMDIYYSKGEVFAVSNQTAGIDLGVSPVIVGDFNGDGKSDIVNFTNIFSPMNLLYFGKEGKEKVLEKVKNGFGHVTEWNYQKIADGGTFYKQNNLTSFPLNTIQPALHAVSEFKSENGVGGYSTLQYSYEEAKLHRSGKGFLGFKKIIVNNLASGRKVISENEFNTTFYTVAPYKTSTYLSSDNSLLSETTQTNHFTDLGSKRFWYRVNGTTENNTFEGRTGTTTNSYNSDGNVTQSTVKLKHNADSYDLETIVTDVTYPSSGFLMIRSKPTSTTVTKTRNGQSSYSVATAFSYNGIGQLTSKTDFQGKSKSVTTDYGYNNLGNLTSTTVKPATMTNRSTSATYDTKGRYPESSTNVLGQTSTAGYDPKWGKPLTSTGIDGLTVSYEYDVFGRLKKTNLPEGYSVEQSYTWNQTFDYVYYVQVNHPGKPNVSTLYDRLGRECATKTEAFPSGVIDQFQFYDAKGNIASSTQPYKSGESILTTTTGYDAYNRPTSTSNSVFGTTSISYSYSNGLLTTTTTSPEGRTSSKTTDASGKVVSATDNGGTLTYTYYSHGGLKDVKNGSTVLTSSEYDEYGRQTKLVDLNAGTTLYDYNSLGELVSQINPNSQTQAISYDLLGRQTSVSQPEGTTSYEYFSSGSGASTNQLKKVTGFSGDLEEYTYDNKGRMQTAKQTVDGTAYTSSFSYDTYGALTSKTFPSGVTVYYNYDGNGYLSTIKTDNNTKTIYTGTNANGTGQVTSYSLGNSKNSTCEYNYGIPTRLYTPDIQDLRMSWNYQTGNLTQRKDDRRNKTEDFSYDNLNRLLTSTVSGQSAITINYAPNGNINSKTDAGTSYEYDGTKINALAKIAAESAIPLHQQDITYTSYRQPSQLTENGYEASLTYGSDYNRIRSLTKQNNNEINRRYYFGDYEVDVTSGTTRHIHYISSPAGLVAILVKEGSTTTYNYTYTDHLGSILTVTNESGNVTFEQNFDAWGRFRNPSDWNYANLPTPPVWLFRGYTGHEHLPQFGLINMNGRMYDPVVARMLSTDNYVQDPGFSQSFNRYSYALNNPLKYTDPDGNYLFLLPQIGFGKNGFSLGLEVGVGFKNGVSASLSFGYNFKHEQTYWSVQAGVAGLNVGYGSGGGFAGFGGNLGGVNLGVGVSTSGGAYIGIGVAGSLNNFSGGGGVSWSDQRGFDWGVSGGYSLSWSENFELVIQSEESKNLSSAEVYNSSFQAEVNDILLKEKIKEQFGIVEGMFNIELITTRTGDGYELNDDLSYLNMNSKKRVAGYYRPKQGFHRPELHISPKVTVETSDILFRSTAGHELIHAYHSYRFGRALNRVFTERVAYQYSYNVLMNGGYTSKAMSTWGLSNKHGFWGAYPSSYKVPQIFNW